MQTAVLNVRRMNFAVSFTVPMLTSSGRVLGLREASGVPQVPFPGKAPILATDSLPFPHSHLHTRAMPPHAHVLRAPPKYGLLLCEHNCSLLDIQNTFGCKCPYQTCLVVLHTRPANSPGNKDCSRRLGQRENHAQALLKSFPASQTA